MNTILLWLGVLLSLVPLYLLLNWLPTLLVGYGLDKHQASRSDRFQFGRRHRCALF